MNYLRYCNDKKECDDDKNAKKCLKDLCKKPLDSQQGKEYAECYIMNCGLGLSSKKIILLYLQLIIFAIINFI